MIIKINENGEKVISREAESPAVQDVRVPLTALTGTQYLGDDRLGQIMHAVRDYYLNAECTVPADAADAVMPTFGAIVDATEKAAAHRQAISKTKSDAAKCRANKKSELPDINLPEIVVPAELDLPSIVRAGVTIQPKEYMSVMALFFLRGFKVGEQRAFYAYYAHTQWNKGVIDGIDARMGTAQRWQQLVGDRRFGRDSAAHTLLKTLFGLLPAELRGYLLVDDVRVEINGRGRVELFVPKPVHGDILNDPRCMEAVQAYVSSHELKDAEFGLTPVTCHVEMSNRK